ncbi:hypothetical protein [Sulfurimonas sp. HSL-1716]|uniref:hypothetical protein n=1 Tax=Hydrocurvibacter sulfurireducens TaxID=3131937 RepID=UPI0031FA3D85
MLENSVWKQYHEDMSIREVISRFYEVDPALIIDDEKELYALLKRKLTKKELRLFTMDSANVSDKKMMEFFEVDAKELSVMKDKLYKKMRQDKLRYPLRMKQFSQSRYSEE